MTTPQLQLTQLLLCRTSRLAVAQPVAACVACRAPNPVTGTLNALSGAGRLVRDLLLLPYTLACVVSSAWQAAFNSQR